MTTPATRALIGLMARGVAERTDDRTHLNGTGGYAPRRSLKMTRERTIRKRGHKNETRERRIDPTPEGLEVANHPNFDEESEQSTPVTPDAGGHLVRSTDDAPG